VNDAEQRTVDVTSPNLCYEQGYGVQKNVPEAVKRYATAAEKGHAEAVKNLRRLIDAMA
jgi:TPR repeat protein